MATQPICRYNKFGYCKFKDTCRKNHINTLCENSSCDVQICTLRHPKECKHYRNHGRCKFGEWCRFSHIEKEDELKNLRLENDTINKKLADLEKNVFEKERVFNQNDDEVKNLKLENETVNQKLADIEKSIIEKDRMFDNFVASMLDKFRKLEDKIYQEENNESETDMTFCNPYLQQPSEDFEFVPENSVELENHMKEIHENINNEKSNPETVEKEVEVIYQCDLCDFKTTHSPGLKIHKTKVHNIKVKYPCDQCSEGPFDSKKKLKSHIYCVHSGKYKTLAQLIDECNP